MDLGSPTPQISSCRPIPGACSAARWKPRWLDAQGAPEAQQRLGHRRRCFLRQAALARPRRLCSGQFPHRSDPEWCRHVANSNLLSSITSPGPISRKSPIAVTPSWRNASTDHGRRTRTAWSAGLLLVCGNHHVQGIAGLVLSAPKIRLFT